MTRRRKPKPRASAQAPAPSVPGATAWWPWLIVPLLAAVTLAAYWNSFSGVFLLDDNRAIVESWRVRELGRLEYILGYSTRPVSRLTFAINYAAGGLDPWGYHAVNLAIHVLAGIVLFGIARRTLAGATCDERDRRAAPWLAAAIAALWLAHPLQTAAVTYIVQRDESLMGLLFLLTVYCGMRACRAQRPWPWTLAAVAACALGMGTKEAMATAPLIMLLYDRTFVAGSFAEALRRRFGLYLGLAATWLILALLLWRSAAQLAAGMSAGPELMTPLGYAMTQPGVIVHYLRLALWPSPLVLDYGWPPARTIGDVALPAILVAALLAATLVGLWRNAWLGFAGAWFFVILAPTSSIVPIADAAFEHRMYLPLAAVVVVAVMGAHRALAWAQSRLGATDALRRAAAACLAVVAIAALAVTTARRNDDYRSVIAMWSDNIAKRPEHARPRNDLGKALAAQGRTAEAIAHLREAVRLKPDFPSARVNLGLALAREGAIDEAIAQYEEALRLHPDYAPAHNALGSALAGRNDLDAAIARYREAIRLDPGDAEAESNLGAALFRQGRSREAIAHFARAIELKPNDAAAHNNMGAALGSEGRTDEAIRHFAHAVRLKPDFAEARDNLRRAQGTR